jgi:hypothetical protein
MRGGADVPSLTRPVVGPQGRRACMGSDPDRALRRVGSALSEVALARNCRTRHFRKLYTAGELPQRTAWNLCCA